MKRIIVITVLAVFVTVAMILVVAGLVAGAGYDLELLAWLIWGMVVSAIVAGITFFSCWLDLIQKEKTQSQGANIRQFRRTS